MCQVVSLVGLTWWLTLWLPNPFAEALKQIHLTLRQLSLSILLPAIRAKPHKVYAFKWLGF